MATINLKAEVKAELDNTMLKELKNNPHALISTLRNKYGLTYSDFIKKLLKSYKKSHL